MYFTKIFVILFIAITCANSAKILGIFHVSSYSHFLVGNALLTELAKRGHEVTSITPYDPKPAVKNHHAIVIPELLEPTKKFVKSSLSTNRKTLFHTKAFKILKYESAEILLNNTSIKELLKSNEKFDIMIMDHFLSELLRGFQYHYNVPCILFSTIGAHNIVNAIAGNPSSPSYVPDILHPFSEHMTFIERLKNSYYTFLAYKNYYYNHKEENIFLHKYFPDAPHITDLIYNTSLILLNSDISIAQSLPLVPNMIEVGGIHVKPPGKLPEDLQTFLDNSKEGVIYFSLGSNVQSKNMIVKIREAIVKVFSKLKMKVLWKWEDDVLPGQPDNVIINKWFPQQDILAHPNVKLFITHGGLLSTTEAVYFGKPVLGIPFFADQENNMKKAAEREFGLSINYEDITEELFSKVVNELLTNPKFAENAKKRSNIMHDKPMKPLDKAVFWVEYTVRHNGAYHFRSSALDLEWYQYFLLDVATFVIVTLLLALFTIYFMLKKIIYMFKKQNNVDKLKKNK